MNIRKSKSFKKLRYLPYRYMFSIPENKQFFYVFLSKHPILAWFFRQFIKLLSFQLMIFSDVLEYNNYWSHRSEYIIIGENPIITLALLKHISDKGFDEKRKIKVLVIKFSNHDYWGYHSFEQKHNWDEISKIAETKIENLQDFAEACLSYEDNAYIDIDYVDSSSKIFHHRFDKITKQWIVILEREVKTIETFANKMPTVLKLEGVLKERYWENILNYLSEIKVKISAISQDKKEHDMILFGKQILLTSYPDGWLETREDSQDYFSTFKHAFSYYSFGTSKRMANSFDLLEAQAISDIKNTLNFELK